MINILNKHLTNEEKQLRSGRHEQPVGLTRQTITHTQWRTVRALSPALRNRAFTVSHIKKSL